MKKLFNSLKSWRIGDYIRQFSIVAAGVIVTFMGSDLISNHNQQKEVASVMQFIKSELEQNKKDVENLYVRVSLDRTMGQYIADCDYDVRKIPVDTLQKYRWFITSTSGLKYTSDALEVLKNSSLMQQVNDKKMLLNLVKSYDLLRQMKVDVAEFYRIKGDILTPIILSMSRSDKDKIMGNSIYESYEMILENTEMQNFCTIATGFLDENLFSNALENIDKNIKDISQQYPAE